MGGISDFHGRLALVTGAASGIGLETARALRKKGARVVVCDVNEDRLEAVANELDAPLRAVVDVADKSQMEAFAERVHDELGPLDILVNNAGVAVQGGFLDTSIEDFEWIVGINFWGVIYGCHYFVLKMVGRGGQVVNVSSVLGYAASPATNAYCATKFGVLGFSTALRQELASKGVGVTTICPGVVNTAITQNTRYRGSADPEQTRAKVVESYRRRNYGPDRVAAAIVEAIQKDRDLVPVTPEAWALYYLQRAAPEVMPAINRLLQRLVIR